MLVGFIAVSRGSKVAEISSVRHYMVEMICTDTEGCEKDVRKILGCSTGYRCAKNQLSVFTTAYRRYMVRV